MWGIALGVLALLVLVPALRSGQRSEVQLVALQSENAALRQELDQPRPVETVTAVETVTETVTEVQTVPEPAVTETVTERVTETEVAAAAPQPQPLAQQPPAPASGGRGCSPEYSGACVPSGVGDVDCGDLSDSGFASIGSDPHELDGDSDGIACES